MTSEEGSSSFKAVVMSARHRLPYATSKLERADRTLSRVWTFQIVLIGAATLAIMEGWPALKDKINDVLGVLLPPEALALLLASLLLYTFMRFGFALGQFLASRQECDALVVQEPIPVRRKSGDLESEEWLRPSLFETTNLFEPLHQQAGFDVSTAARWVRGILMGFVVLTVSVGHAATFSLIYHGLKEHTVAAAVVTVAVLGILITCYCMMCRSAAGRPIVRAGWMLAGILLLSGAGTAWGILASTALGKAAHQDVKVADPPASAR